jgi:diguanylate cyclase (GGDEF)-like protein
MSEHTRRASLYFETLEQEDLSEDALLAVAGLRRIMLRQVEMLSEKDRLIHEANDRASTDALTGLKNRGAFDQDLQMLVNDLILMSHQRQTEPFAQFRWMVILGDLDYFKLVNDVLGYEFGDATLATIARLIQESVRHNDRVYRLGGDEFAAIIPVIPGKEDAAFEAITRRFYYGLELMRANQSEMSPELEALQAIGISFAHGVFGDVPKSADDLIKTVAETMRRVKNIKEAKGTDLR